MSYKPKCYIAGKMSGLTWEEASGWRNTITYLLQDKFEILSPMRGVDPALFIPDTIPAVSTRGLEMTRDLHDIERADVVLVRFALNEAISFGTAVELGTCIPLRKPVVFVMDPKDRLQRHPFIEDFPRRVMTSTLEDAAKHLMLMFNV